MEQAGDEANRRQIEPLTNRTADKTKPPASGGFVAAGPHAGRAQMAR
jgi:hypothetical protein